MKFDLIITQIDEHNEVGVILSKKYNVRSIVMLYISDKSEKIEGIKDLYNDILPNVKLLSEHIGMDYYKDLKNMILKYKNKSMIINLTGGERLISLLLLKLAEELNIQCIYVDLLNKKRYVFSDKFRVIEEVLEDIKISDVIELSGASVISDSTNLIEKSDILEFTKVILKNLDIWHKYKQRLYDNNIFMHNYKDSSRVVMNKELVGNEELIIVKKILDEFKDKDEVNYIEDKKTIEVTFKNDYLKSFIFKSGTWLEVITTIVMGEIKEIDEVKSGIIFFWSDDAKRVRNELDVVAIRDSILICISCKDSDKYDEDTLNELQVYAERLGGKKSIKILVATKEPVKKSVMDRAQKMNINLVILDKDIEKFKKRIVNIIKN